MDGDFCGVRNCARSSPAVNLGIEVKWFETLRHRYFIVFTIILLFISTAVCTFSSLGFGLSILTSYIGAVFLINRIFGCKFQSLISNLIRINRNVNDRCQQSTTSSARCSVCFTLLCKRNDHLRTSVSNEQLFVQMRIPAVVDNALEEFLHETLEKYIYFWHQEITDEGSFLCELKENMQCLVLVLIQRLQRVDLSRMIIRKLLKAGFSHVDCYFQVGCGKGGRSDKMNLDDAVFDYCGNNLHVAVYSRAAELRYLHCLCERVLPYLLPAKYARCSSFVNLFRELLGSLILLYTMDILADPDVINNLLIILFDKTPMDIYQSTLEAPVLLLENFVRKTHNRTRTKLGQEISSPVTHQAYLYPFMTFLKNDGCVGILQFYLAVEDFKDKLLDPDLCDQDIRLLHQEVKKMYELYMAPNGIDKLNFSKQITEEFRNVAEGPYGEVVRLRTTPHLYEAHEYVYNLLERNVPLFCRSEEYFELLCGSRNRMQLSKSSDKSLRRRFGSSTAAKIGSKINRIRGVLMPVSAIDGQIEEELTPDLADAGFEAEEMKLDIDSTYGDFDDLNVRDLSAWRVSIPRVESHKGENGKQYFVYVIDVQRIDVLNKENPDQFHWVVERRYHEFYVLESKLMEFHGEFVDTHLPVKKSFGSTGLEYLELRRAAFEEFLQRLLQKPAFRGSELLFTFLTSQGDFTKGLLPDIKLGRMIKNVPMKLVKERGQHLESFLQNLVVSTETVKVKSSKTEFKDIKDGFLFPHSIVMRRLQKSIYADNAGKRLNQLLGALPRSNSVLPMRNFCDYLLYIWVKVLHMPQWTLQMLLVPVKCCGSLVDIFVENYLNNLLCEVLVPQRIAVLIHLLKDIVFPMETVKRTEEDKRLRAQDALHKAQTFLPRLLVSVIGQERHDDGFAKLFELLQHPRLNKQLLYTLLDIVVVELFPELEDSMEKLKNGSGDQRTLQNGRLDIECDEIK